MTQKTNTLMKSTASLVTALFLGVVPSWQSNAGELLELYANRNESDPMIEALKYRKLAAQQRVTTSRLGYLPSVALESQQLWLEQDVWQNDSDVFQSGTEGYAVGRLNVLLDQPLFDATLAPQVAAAQALYHRTEVLFNLTIEQATQRIAENYLNATRHYSKMRSLERVKARLEKELEKVTKNFEVKLATVAEVETVKMNLTSARLDLSVARQDFDSARLNLGADYSSGKWSVLAPNAVLPAGSLMATNEGPSDLAALHLEVASLEQEAIASKRHDWPRVSLYSKYSIDDADDSNFGGARNVEDFEVGVGIRWDAFDRGVNRSRAKELSYLKMSKAAEYEAKMAELDGMKKQGLSALEQSQKRVTDARELMDHQAAILDAADKGYNAGTESYLNDLNAFLLYESSVRDWESARFEQLSQWMQLSARSSGWTKGLIEVMDPLFAIAE
jgi:outer membrane protein TolC